ncbi:ornithine-acyl-ACP acyltransferase [Rubrivivax gelatinosus]|uniref:GNAT family N-acetyltransferase n=1 Tax=Rubrivivax gelatinosus TaxID=28068 RepID=UPI00190529B1|nr:ornithine-acyl-ACP acyltransferase [Rubrivivax gelatinosus]
MPETILTPPLAAAAIEDRSSARNPRRMPGATAEAEAALTVAWARDDDEVREAQALRHEVFVGEMGARLDLPAGTPAGLDVDRYDAFCEHLLVRAPGDGAEPGPVVGTYRVMTPAAAARAGGLYSENEFDLAPLAPLRTTMVELGRSCVHPDWRSGGVVMALWAALATFMARNGLQTMVGCASVGMRDGGHAAASLWRRLEASHLAAPEWRVRPRLALPVEELRQDLDVDAPPLLKGYLRCGARVLGAPAWDPDFNTADLPVMLRLDDLPARYRRHFLGA